MYPDFSLIPAQETVIYGSRAVPGVPMPDLAGVSSVIWVSSLNQGTITYDFDPETGLTNTEVFTDTTPYEDYLDLASRTIFCFDNPKTFWSTVSPVGQPVKVTALDWPQPANTYDEAPPESPSANSVLFWSGTAFVWSTFPVGLSLNDAKEFLCSWTDQRAYSLLLKSDWLVVREMEVGTVIPTDWGTWRAEIRTLAASKKSVILSKTSTENLNEYAQSEEFLSWPPSPGA
jgi:hypothetical protein